VAELKTKKNAASVEGFLNTIKDKQKRDDSFSILEMFTKATGEKPTMWGPSIVGFGNVHLKYDSGRELDWMKIAFSPRKQNLTLYVLCNSKEQNELLKKLGKHKTGQSCLYINKLSDVDPQVLKKIIERGYTGSFADKKTE
jgi:Domain of unknown function (DU1801)